jgi:hypothetical protein
VTVSVHQGNVANNRLAAIPGGATSPLYVSPRGRGDGQAGLLVIIPAVGAVATSIGVDAKMMAV